MTQHDDIPELFGRLESRLASPAAEAIRQEAARRNATRRRALATTGAFALIVAIAGGALWFTRDGATTTATAAADVPASPADSAVADDSAPLEISAVDRLKDLGPSSILAPFEDAPFLPRDGAFVSFTLTRRDSSSGDLTERGMLFSDGCEADAYWIEWADDGFTLGERELLPPNSGRVETTRCKSIGEQPVLESLIGPGQFVFVDYNQANNTFGLTTDGRLSDASDLVRRRDLNRAWSLVLEGPPQAAPTGPTSTPATTGPPPDVLPTIDARSVDDCVAGFKTTAAASWRIYEPAEDETAWAIFQAADDWEGRTDVCWIAITTDSTCRSYAWFRTLGVEPGKFQEDPPLNASEPCVGDGKEFR